MLEAVLVFSFLYVVVSFLLFLVTILVDEAFLSLARFEDLNIISLEDHHVCRQILRLSNTVGTGSGR